MKEFDINKGSVEPLTIALGFFDCLHIGHKRLVSEAIDMSYDTAQAALFTFRNNPFALLCSDTKPVYNYEERKHTLLGLGVHNIVFADFDKEFMAMTKDAFLKRLDAFNLKGIVCGYDYSFGKGGYGKPQDMKLYAESRGIAFSCIAPVKIIGERVSSTNIRKYLKEGDITSVNRLLGEKWLLSGEVIKGDGIGRTIGLPTANLKIDESEKLLCADGVYSGETEIENKKYNCLIHIGMRPTLDKLERRVEVHIKDFSKDLYGKILYIRITNRIRGIEKFNDVNELKAQILKDMNGIND
ncbi:MAG: riboflavin biosynthesis protein RibF [Clostridia bacterium]